MANLQTDPHPASFVHCQPDIEEPLMALETQTVEKPSSLVFPSAPVPVPHPLTSPGQSQIKERSSGPPSPLSSPVVDRVHSFRDNLHHLKEKFSSRKSTDEDREKLLPSSTESVGSGSHSPSLIGKLVKKLEERRGSGQGKDSQPGSGSGSVSPTKDVQGALTLLAQTEARIHGRSESLEQIPRYIPPFSRDASSRYSDKIHENYDTLSTQSEPADVYFDSIVSVPKTVSIGTPLDLRPPSATVSGGEYKEDVTLKENGRQFGGVPGKKVETKVAGEPMSFAALTPFLIVAGVLVAIVVVPMPSFMSGLLFGCILTAAASVRIWFTVLFPRKSPDMYRFQHGPASLISNEYTSRSSSQEEGKPRPGEGLSTWMNQQVGDFDVANFHVNQTQSVYVTLEGFSLRVRKPKSRVVSRRAMFDEELKSDTFTFVENRVYNIQGATVSLVPEDIPRKKRWLWRFPIGIKLVDPASIALLNEEIREHEQKKLEKDKEKEEKEKKEREKHHHHHHKEKDVEREEVPVQSEVVREHNTLFLMPRSDRDKLDWYWRFCSCTGQNPSPMHRPNLSANLSTLNLFFHRVFYDILTEPTWALVIKKKIQKKLSVIALPYYIEELQITEIDLGKHLPVIGDVSQKPRVDDRGVWIEMNFEYHGTVHMTLATKLNLMKLKKDKEGETECRGGNGESDVAMDTLSVGSVDSVGPSKPVQSEVNPYESDEADEFDDGASTLPPEVSGSSKLTRFVEKITDSKAFQKLTEVGIVRRAMENVSDTDLTLTVVVERLAGRLTINLPHPPCDKVWYGFVEKPELCLRAFPKLGEREVTFDQVTTWIEKKLTTEFHRLITMPNMDDLTVPVMNSALDEPEARLAKLSELILK